MNPEISMIQYFDDHYYKVVEGEKTFYIPSVTTKLGIVKKSGLDRWRGDVGNREADLRMYEASNRGKRIHYAYETFLKGGAVIYDPWQSPVYTQEAIKEIEQKYLKVAILRTQDEMAQIAKLQKQFDILKPEVLAVEEMVWDTDKLDAGTIDSVFKIKEGVYEIAGKQGVHLDEGIYINDLKTGNYLDDNVWMQLAPYAYMYEKRTGRAITGALVTHTGASIKSGIVGLRTLVRPKETLMGADYADYRHASALWERDHAEDQPKDFVFPSLITRN